MLNARVSASSGLDLRNQLNPLSPCRSQNSSDEKPGQLAPVYLEFLCSLVQSTGLSLCLQLFLRTRFTRTCNKASSATAKA